MRYEYDYKRRKTAIDLNDTKSYVKFEYTDKAAEDGKTVNKAKATYTEREDGIKDTFETVTDMRGNVLKSKHNGETQVSYTYDDKNRLATFNDKVSGEFKYAYDALDRVTDYTGGGITEAYAYNPDGNIATKTVTVGESVKQYVYAYKDNAAKDLESVTADGVKISPQTDILGRNSGKEISISGKKIASETIAYCKVGDHATNMPSTIRFGNRFASVIASSEATRQSQPKEFVLLDSLKYKYDSCGNITEIWENGKLAAKYTYDKLNRLIREDNKQRYRTLVFTYDNNGNILSKRDVSFTLKDIESFEDNVGAENLYAYSGDRLMAYGNERCEYDGMGNAKVYRDKACSWEKGRQLVSYDGNTFAYDGQGKRITKNGISYTYDSNGNLLKQTDGANTLEFIYDDSGVAGVKYDNKTYVYRKNAQGDIIAILDSAGAVVVKYVYDAWGNHDVHLLKQVYASEQSTHIGYLNPFRYRGYYYDTETKLYYLKTRYYDPVVGRFITIDDLSYIDPEHINGLNLYAYCGNNPVMNVDPTGCFAGLIFAILGIFFLVGGVIGGVSAYHDGVQAGKTGIDLFLSTLAGFFLGGFVGIAVGGLVISVVSAGLGAVFGISMKLLGISVLQAFAIGALAFDLFAFIIAPLLGIIMDGIEMLPDRDKTKVPKPGETPRHPYKRNVKRIMAYFKNFLI